MSVAIEFDGLEFDPADFDPAQRPAVPLRPRLRDAAALLPTVPAVPTVPTGPFAAPLTNAPTRRRPTRGLSEVGVITVLRPPAPESAPLRLTRRGVVVLAVAVAALGFGLMWIAGLSAPSSAASPARGPAVVTVHAGDTLWSIASRVAPNSDPAAEVAVLQKLNHVTASTLAAGQHLRVR